MHSYVHTPLYNSPADTYIYNMHLQYIHTGTGKTSFIKSMAQYTGRSLVSLSLATIKTNKELMDLVFESTRYVVVVCGLHG